MKVLVVDLLNEGRSWVIRYDGYVHRLFMICSLHGFQWIDEAGRDNGHGGNITGGDLSVIRTSTDVDDMRGDTGATLDETGTGT